MAEPITYAIVGGPPDDWHSLRVFDPDGNEIDAVVEVNAAEGWLIRNCRNAEGQFYAVDGEIAQERIEGVFSIKRPNEA